MLIFFPSFANFPQSSDAFSTSCSDTGETSSGSSLRNVKIFCKRILKNRVFLGNYQEKRLVAKLKTYKDLIVLNGLEKELCNDLEKVQQHVLTFYQNRTENIWMGFTSPRVIGAPAAYCIWTTLNNESGASTIAFGEYWFQIKTIKFRNMEIEIQVKILRPANNVSASTNSSASTNTDESFDFSNFVNNNITNVDWVLLFNNWKRALNENTFRFFSEQVTIGNVKEVFRFLGVLFVLIITSLVHSVHYLGEFTLKFMNEASKVIRALTPVIAMVLSVFAKIIGGFYLLLAMMWRDTIGGRGSNASVSPSITPTNYRRILPPPDQYLRSNRRTQPAAYSSYR